MRDINRIDKFCNELAEVWKIYECYDWRFLQLISNVFCEQNKDIFFIEDDEAMSIIKNYFKIDEV